MGCSLFIQSSYFFLLDSFGVSRLSADIIGLFRILCKITVRYELGAEVIMSSHILRARNCDEVVDQMLAMEKRGSDIVKIVTAADTESEFVEAVKTTMALRHG